jgi:D-arabinose 1-dehydrogenase-like Zn-dependent alcohol dehydrogenase
MAETTPTHGGADTLTPTKPAKASTPKDTIILGDSSPGSETIQMKAIVVTDQAAGTAGMTLVERPEPQAAINDVVVEVHASGFVGTELAWPSTWTDRLDRDRTPTIPGHELAGVVTALGYGTTGLSVGQRVFGLTDWYRDGTLAESVAVEARNLAPLPGDVDFTVGASLPISGLTAWQGLFDHGRLRPGQSVIAHGAAGAVGSMVTQLAREIGAYVIGTGRAADRQAARTSSSTSTTRLWKTSAASIWCSISSAATSGSGPRAWFEPEELWCPSSGRPRRGPSTASRSTSLSSPIVLN